MTNWLGQSDFRGTWDNPPGYSSSVSMEMLNTSVIVQPTSADVVIFEIGQDDAWNYQYLIQNLTVTAFNSNGSDAYVGLRLRMYFSYGTSGTFNNNANWYICGNRSIGPNQTAQIISKDAPITMGYTFANSTPDFSADGRIWKLDARTQFDANKVQYSEMHFHISYLKISRASE